MKQARQVNLFEAVKRRADIVRIAERFTGMKAAGRGNQRHLPECPFCKGHGCFSISVDKQLFNCFQCPRGSTGGDVFTFLSRLKGVDLGAALKEIARDVGYTLPERQKGTKPGIRDAIMDQARNDWSLPEAKPFREYLVSERHLSEEVLRGHDVGWLRERSVLISDLKKKGYTYEEIKASGILTQGFGGLYRILFGWRGLDGKVAGFVGAATKGQLEKIPPSEKDRFPKYKKSANFKAAAPYNLFYARRRVPEDQTLVIVEGIVDCLHLLSIGIGHVIALGGSTFKEEFTKALQTTRFKRLILFFDSDQAGSDGTERTIQHLLETSNYSLYVAQIAAADPADPSRIIKDPDELICTKGPELTKMVIASPVKAGPWMIGALWSRTDMKNPLHRDNALQRIGVLWHLFSDEVERKEMLVLLSEACGLPQENLRKTIEQYVGRQTEADPDKNKQIPAVGSGEKKGDDHALIQKEKNRALQQKLKEAVKKNRDLNHTNRILLKAYASLVCQARGLSRAGLLWHVSRLVEGHTALIRQIRRDPDGARVLIQKVETVFYASGLNDLDRIREEVDRLSRVTGEKRDAGDA